MSAAQQSLSSVGALLAIGLCGLLLHAMPLHSLWMIAPSVVIFYVQPHSPIAQPRLVSVSYFFAAHH